MIPCYICPDKLENASDMKHHLLRIHFTQEMRDKLNDENLSKDVCSYCPKTFSVVDTEKTLRHYGLTHRLLKEFIDPLFNDKYKWRLEKFINSHQFKFNYQTDSN